MFVFNKAIGKYYEKYIEGKHIVTGSLKNNFVQSSNHIYDNSIISLDFFKYLNDFNGVTQFVGVGINSSNLKRIIKEGAVDTELKQSVTNVSFIYGWETHVYSNPRLSFRTTLRYNPFDVLEFDNQKLSFNKFEFTFFELVFYPQRIFIP